MSPAFGGYLLDTSVLSALGPGKPALAREFVDWFRAQTGRLFIPCIAIAELEQGIRKLHRAGGIARATQLTTWLDGLLKNYADQVLPLDAATSRLLGQMAETASASGRNPGLADTAIAAIAQQHGLQLLTCNLRHFQVFGIACADPFKQLPS